MKVLETADTVGGVWTYALDLARAAHDVEFVIATMGAQPSDAQWKQAASLPNVRLVTSDWKLEWMDDPWDDVTRAGAWLLDLEQREAPDVVHLNGYSHGALPFIAPKVVVAHSCVMSWWRAVKGEDAPPSWKPYRDCVGRGLRSADCVIAPSEWMLTELKKHYAFQTPQAVIYNGRYTRAAAPAERREQVFAAGRFWDEAKNLKTVAAAEPRLHWPLELAGDGCPAGRLDEDAMASAYARAGIYLFPALYEPFGLSVLEAALAGCALVLGDIGSLRDLWEDAAVFVPPRDVDAIVSEVNALIADEARRHALAQRARARAERFTPSRTAAGYREVYRQLQRHEVRA
jgi:glycogen(starch) synthase